MNHRSHLTALALIGTLLGAGCAAGAQSASSSASPDNAMPAAHGRAHRTLMARAMEGLDLTPDQKDSVKAAQAKFRASRQTSTPETREQLMTDVESSLSPTQKTQFESNVKSIRAQMRAERKDGGAQAPASPNPQ